MLPDILYTELTQNLKNIIEFIATAAAGGVVGNRVDYWFMSLFYHQRKRIVYWLNEWNPKIEDLQNILEDENIRLLFSKVLYDISNEINDSKLIFWPSITDSILRKKEIHLNKKQYFITLFNRFDEFSLIYLATLYVEKEIDYFEIFNKTPEQSDNDSRKHLLYLGQLQCSTTGLTDFRKESNSNFYLTKLGYEFVEFISDSTNENLKRIIRN